MLQRRGKTAHKKKRKLPLWCFSLQFWYMIFKLSTSGLNFYILLTKLLPLCRQSIKLISSILLNIKDLYLYLVSKHHRKDGRAFRCLDDKKNKSPDDIFSHDLLPRFFQIAAELTSAFCKSLVKIQNTEYVYHILTWTSFFSYF